MIFLDGVRLDSGVISAVAALIAAFAAASSAFASRVSAQAANFQTAWEYAKEIIQWNQSLVNLITDIKDIKRNKNDQKEILENILNISRKIQQITLNSQVFFDKDEKIIETNVRQILEYWAEDQKLFLSGDVASFSTEKYVIAQIELTDEISKVLQVKRRFRRFKGLM